jgi:stage III sporulation protein AE
LRIFCWLFIFLLIPTGGALAADPLETAIEEQLEALDLDGIRDFLATLEPEARAYLPSLDVASILRGRTPMEPGRFLRDLLLYLWREVTLGAHLLGQLIVLAVLCSLLQSLQRGLPGGASDVAFAVSLAAITLLALGSFSAALDIARETIDAMVSFMQALLPTMATLLVAVGAITSATVFSPLLYGVVTGVATLVETLVFPLIFVAAVLGIAGHFSPHFPLSRLAALARQGGILLLGAVFSVFLGVMVVRGALAPVADGAALRTAKFLTGTLVPVIGGMFADAVEVVVGGSLLIKNAIGVLGLLVLMVVAAFPMVKIASMIIIYRLVAALVQPISDERLPQALGSLADSLTLVFLAVGTVALMFFVAITIIIGVGSLAALAR